MSQPNNKVIVVVGERSVGKSAIVHRLIDESYDFGVYKPTIDDCYNVAWKLLDGQYLQIQFIDTAGWNEFPAMQSLYVKMAHLVIVVYDVVSSEWRESLLSVINGVRRIKDDADIVVVGNKCDKLTATDQFTPSDLSEVIGHSCVGNVYTSAMSQQGISGLKQLILCSKSQLTEGHYTELSHVPKKKKLKKKLTGLALLLHLARKDKANDNQDDKTKEQARYREPVIYPERPHYVPYNDLRNGNFDKLFDNATKEQPLGERQSLEPATLNRVVYRYEKNRGRSTRSSGHNSPKRERRRSAIDSGITSDYSSPGTSPSSTYDFILRDSTNNKLNHRKSIDFSQLTLDCTSPSQSPLSRRKSRSCALTLDKKQVSVTSSISTVMSDSSSDSLPSCRRSSISSLIALEQPRQSTKKVQLRRSSALCTGSFDYAEEIDTMNRPLSSSHIYNIDNTSSQASKSSDDVIHSKIIETPLAGVQRARRKKGHMYRHSRHRSESEILSINFPLIEQTS